MKISICCFFYNSELTVDLVLNRINNLKGSFELIIVDNNSSDRTNLVLSNRKLKNVKIIIEQRQGLNYSRSTAVKNSTGDILIFCDDDNLLDDDYLVVLCELFNSFPKLGAVGPGKIFPVDIDGVQLNETLRQFFQYKNENRFFLKGGPDYGWKNIPPGTGLCIRREVAIEYFLKLDKGVYSCEDRNGLSLTSGGDTQLVLEAVKLGYVIGISGKLKLEHLTIPKKLKKKYIKRLYYALHSDFSYMIEAWPGIENYYKTLKARSTFEILLSHFMKYKNRSLRL
jgi:glycosyltransferase involved in cell wall biosynthesis